MSGLSRRSFLVGVAATAAAPIPAATQPSKAALFDAILKCAATLEAMDVSRKTYTVYAAPDVAGMLRDGYIGRIDGFRIIEITSITRNPSK